MDDERYDVGQELIPYPGGGDYGQCFKCKKTGVIVITVPQPTPTKVVGWNL